MGGIINYIEFIGSLGIVAILYSVILVLTIFMMFLMCYIGYTGKMLRGSKRTIKFYYDNGWVDKSNIRAFIDKCIVKFPYVVRANFSLYNNTDKKLTDFINDSSFIGRDYAVRERIVKCVYDFTLAVGLIIAIVHLSLEWGLYAGIGYLGLILSALIIRYILIAFMLFREIRARKKFLKAVDLMANGIFLPKETLPEEDSYEDVSIDRINDREGVISTEGLKCLSVDQTH